jgi:hypothetical protein
LDIELGRLKHGRFDHNFKALKVLIDKQRGFP